MLYLVNVVQMQFNGLSLELLQHLVMENQSHYDHALVLTGSGWVNLTSNILQLHVNCSCRWASCKLFRAFSQTP